MICVTWPRLAESTVTWNLIYKGFLASTHTLHKMSSLLKSYVSTNDHKQIFKEWPHNLFNRIQVYYKMPMLYLTACMASLIVNQASYHHCALQDNSLPLTSTALELKRKIQCTAKVYKPAYQIWYALFSFQMMDQIEHSCSKMYVYQYHENIDC